MTTFAPPKVGFDRILVPVDFTDVSDRALDYAKSIARMNNSELILAHACEPFNPVTPAETVWFSELTETEPEKAQLETHAAQLQSHGYRARAVASVGRVHEEILNSAAKEQADLMVVGTHGRSGVLRFLFGSEAEAMYRRSNCPILVIGPAVRPAYESVWPPKDILCACDLDPASAPMVAYAYRLAQEFGATFSIQHVDNSEGKVSREFMIGSFKKALEPLLIGEDKSDILWRTLTAGFNVGSTIADMAIERSSDLIVMGAHPPTHPTIHFHFVRGNAHQVVAKAPCPVMVIHT